MAAENANGISTTPADVEIVEFQPQYRDHWKSLNLQWIEKYFSVEEPDRKVLEYPEENILAIGGRIFFARLLHNGEIVGTCALLKKSPTKMELGKMAVAPHCHGKQIGKRLCLHAIAYARAQQGVTQVYLESNTCLTPALELYKRVGFREVPISGSPYSRANIKMELDL